MSIECSGPKKTQQNSTRYLVTGRRRGICRIAAEAILIKWPPAEIVTCNSLLHLTQMQILLYNNTKVVLEWYTVAAKIPRSSNGNTKDMVKSLSLQLLCPYVCVQTQMRGGLEFENFFEIATPFILYQHLCMHYR